MSRFKIGVLSGVAAVYAAGMGTAAQVLRAGESVELGSAAEPKADEYTVGANLVEAAARDVAAPAAGVATDEPFNSRDGLLRVEVLTGRVAVRTYEGTDFTTKTVREGDSVDVEVTETNRITLAVYEL